MTTAHDFFESTGILLRKPLKEPVLQEALLKAPEAVKQAMVYMQRMNAGHVLHMSASEDYLSPKLYCRHPMRDTFSQITEASVSLRNVEGVYMTKGNESIFFGSEKYTYTARDVAITCTSGTAYRVCYYDTKGAYQKMEKGNALSLLIRASTLTFFLYSLWTVRLGNTYPLLPKGSVYGN